MEKEQQNESGVPAKPRRGRPKGTTKNSSTRTKNLSSDSKKKLSEAIGVGDVIEVITEATGIRRLFDRFAPDCGCDLRREKLNKTLGFYTPMTKEQKAEFDDVVNNIKDDVITTADQTRINELYRTIFNRRAASTSCGSCVVTRMSQLQRVYDLCDK